jgi:hypothetical protein
MHLIAGYVCGVPYAELLLAVLFGDDHELALQHDEYLGVGVIVIGRGVARRFYEMLYGYIALSTEADALPVLLGLVILRVCDTYYFHIRSFI